MEEVAEVFGGSPGLGFGRLGLACRGLRPRGLDERQQISVRERRDFEMDGPLSVVLLASKIDRPFENGFVQRDADDEDRKRRRKCFKLWFCQPYS